MGTNSKREDWDLQEHYAMRVSANLKHSPWLLRITEHQGKPSPVLIVKERILPNGDHSNRSSSTANLRLEERGLIYGSALRRCLPIFRDIIAPVADEEGIPLELERFLSAPRIEFQGNLPLDEEAGPKLALVFKLRERVKEMDRVELIARRIERFTREEAAYWFSRITNFGEDPNRWARAGMRTMLGGQPGDPAVQAMLERLRNTY